jgi:hypothetical protein
MFHPPPPAQPLVGLILTDTEKRRVEGFDTAQTTDLQATKIPPLVREAGR